MQNLSQAINHSQAQAHRTAHVHHAHCHCAVPSSPAQLRSLKIALVLVACFSASELWVSVQSHSLSLRADAGHMVADVFAIALALWTAHQTTRLADQLLGDDQRLEAQIAAREDASPAQKIDRLNAIAALVNSGLLLIVSNWLGWEAISGLLTPSVEVLTTPMAVTAAVGLAVNGLNAYLLHAHAEDNLNLRGAFLHMLADAGSCLGVLISALLIAKFGWYRADSVVGGAIALLIFSSAIGLFRQSWNKLRIASSTADAV
jgi:cobalt-zinc-cadmium efflux system protein